MIDAFENSSFETYFLPTPDALVSEAIKDVYEHITEHNDEHRYVYVVPEKKPNNHNSMIDQLFGMGFMIGMNTHM